MCLGILVKYFVAVTGTMIKATKSGASMKERVYLGL